MGPMNNWIEPRNKEQVEDRLQSTIKQNEDGYAIVTRSDGVRQQKWHRAARCGYRYDDVVRRQCKARTRYAIQIQKNETIGLLSGTKIKYQQWQFRCFAHRFGKYVGLEDKKS